MEYLEFKNEYLRLCEMFGRDTKRKTMNDLKSDVKELEYRIDAIEPQVFAKGYGYLYGERHTNTTLRELKTELEFTNKLLTEIKSN